MNICILTPRFPYPQYGGDALRINEVAKHLKSQGHKLILVSMSDVVHPPVVQAKQLYDKVYFVKRNKVMSLLIGAFNFLLGKPIQCGYYSSGAYRKLLREVVQTEKPDLYVSHLLRMAPYLCQLHLEDRSIIEMTDVLSKAYLLSVKAKRVGLLKYVYLLEQRLIAKYELLVTSRFQDTLRHLDAMLPQDPDAAARHFGIGICTSHDDAADPRLQDRFCTWRLFAVVAAGLQGDVHGRAHRGFPRFPAVFQSVPLRMQISVTFMAALPDHRPVRPDNDSSHHRVGGGAAPPFFGQVKGHAHIVLVHFHKLYLPPVR